MNAKKNLLCFVLLTSFVPNLIADNNGQALPQNKHMKSKVNSKSIMCTSTLGCRSPLVAKSYANRDHALAWIANGQLTRAGVSLVQKIRESYLDGLNPYTYHVTQINAMLRQLKSMDSSKSAPLLADLDATLTDAFFLMADHLSNGIVKARGVSSHFTFPEKKNINFHDVENRAIRTGNAAQELNALAPKNPMYARLKEKLAEYYKIAENGGFLPIAANDSLQPGEQGEAVKLIKQRLYTTGELEELPKSPEYDKALQAAIKKFQKNNHIESDGLIGVSTLKALNAPVDVHIQKIALNMDRLRVLPTYMANRHVIINIPSYTLNAYRDGTSVLTMPIVVGKPSRPSCILNSRITQVIFNPYWNVPTSIAGGEIIPELRHNPGFLRENNIRVFRNSNGAEVNPDSIDWDHASTAEYRFRQDPGDQNALGKVKFAFANPCGMYLHDSLARELFEAKTRDLSHGCIRLGLPLNFANYLLGWGSDRIMSTVNSGDRKIVPLSSPVDLYILYLTVLTNSEGGVEFERDIYGLDRLSPYPVWSVMVKRISQEDGDRTITNEI
jgi:L,D-transpeptidase YcbB